MYLVTTRVLAVLELLQTHGRISGADMAARLAIDKRTLRRYIAILEEMGIPIAAERGRFGGYALMPGFKLPPMMFTEDETLALAVGLKAAGSLGLSDGASAVVSAMAKLERVMPAQLKTRVRAVDQMVQLDSRQATLPSARAVLGVLSLAAMMRQRVHLHYRALDGTPSTRDVDPYGLALYGGCWYLLGMCHLRSAMRSFRLDRVLKAETRAASFEPPPCLNPLAQLRRAMATVTRAHAVEILLHTDLATASEHFAADIGQFEQTADGVVLRSETDHIDWFAGHLASMPFEFEIRSPAALRESLVRLGERLLRHADASNPSKAFAP